jgi:hypothetical protein
MTFRRHYLALLILLVTAFLGACRSVGPGTIEKDQFDYSTAIGDSWKRQMLLNIVKMRYGEPPVFLEVASVINQYSLEGSVNAGGNLNAGLTGKDVYSIGGNAKWADRPTITYNPMSGDKFTKSLLTPVPPDRILWLIQSGYGADFVFRLATRSINGIRNHVDMTARHHPSDPEWGPLLAALTRLQNSNAVGMRLRSTATGPTAAMFFNHKVDEAIQKDLAFVKETLGLDPNAREFVVVFGLPENNREIAIQTRSLIEMLLELGNSIDVPIDHVEEGRARYVPHHEGEEHYLIQIHSAPDRPQFAFVETRFDDQWFWIDRSDIYSKQTLTFMMFMASIAETGSPVQAPVVTVSAGQ